MLHWRPLIGYTGITKNVTPHERHIGQDASILASRKTVLMKARQANPARWNGRVVRNCLPVAPTALNPVRPSRLSESVDFLVA